MKQVSLTLYTFDELTPEVQNKVIDRERFNIMDRQMEISNSSFRKTLAKFEQLFSTSVFNWEVDYCGFTYRYKFMRLMRIVLIMSGKMARRSLANFRLKNSAASC